MAVRKAGALSLVNQFIGQKGMKAGYLDLTQLPSLSKMVTWLYKGRLSNQQVSQSGYLLFGDWEDNGVLSKKKTSRSTARVI